MAGRTVDGPSNESQWATIFRSDWRLAAWLSVGFLLVALEAGALAEFVFGFLTDALAFASTVGPFDSVFAGLVHVMRTADAVATEIPTLLSREVFPNAGYWNGERWVGTFLGLRPGIAWAIRVLAVYVYAFAFAVWTILGYRLYRQRYRTAQWTPRDDMVDRFRSHSWGNFGLVVVFLFIVMAVFAPTLGPTTVDTNMRNSYTNEINYWDTNTGQVETVFVGQANLNTQSRGDNPQKVMPFQTDQYGRYHPFGTMPNGRDLFTFIVAGSRLSLLIGLLAVGLSAFLATSLALVSAYYKGRVDLSLVLASDSVMAMPQLLLLIMLTSVLTGTWIAGIYSGGFLLALIFAFTGWAYMWRSLRGPALQISERQWIDAARSYGQTPRKIMRKHMLPYITGYLLIYGSMTLGGAIISIAGLSYLGLGVSPPTPEWGRAIKIGQQYVNTGSWHISLIPGILITIVVTGFNALGDGIRDAIDPQSDAAGDEATTTGGGA